MAVKADNPIKDNIVKEYKIGNTRISICNDAYRDKTQDDIEQILRRIQSVGWKIIESARAAGKDV